MIIVCYINLQVSTTEDDGGEDGSAGSSPTGGVVSSAVAASGASQAVQTISINGQQYQIVSPAPIGNTYYGILSIIFFYQIIKPEF